MRKNLRSKILLCVLAGGVLAANTALAKEYNTAILGSGDIDNVYNSIKTQNGNDYTYTLTEDSVLKIDGSAYGIAISDLKNTDSITVNGANLDIYIENEQTDESADAYGLRIDLGNNSTNKIIDISNSNGNITINTVANGTYQAFSAGADIYGDDNKTIHIGNTTINLSAYNTENGFSGVRGINIESGSNNLITMGNGKILGTAISENSAAEAYGIRDGGFDNDIQVGNVSMEILAEGKTNDTYDMVTATGIMTYCNVEAGNGDIMVTAKNNGHGGSWAQGISANDGAVVTTGNGIITAIAEGGETATAYGVVAVNATVNLGIVDINVEAVDDGNNNPFAIGIYTYPNGSVNMQGGLITTKVGERWNRDQYAIYNSSGFVNINRDGGNNVVINGNIFDSSGETYLNLDTAESVLTGAVQTSDGEITLNLKNGATWNQVFDYDSVITNLNMDNGIIKVDNIGLSDSITIGNYSGIGEIVITAGDNTSNGDIDVDAGRTNIASAAKGSVINMIVSNNNLIGTANPTQALANLNQIANEIAYNDNDGHITGKVTIKEWLIMPEVSGDLLFDENSNVGYVASYTSKGTTPLMDAMKNIAATAIVAWRQEDSTLSQRLGELRESDGGQGIWARMSRGEFEYDGEYKNQYNFFQLGYDWAAGNWHYGAAVSHNDGQTTYTNGDGENRSTSLSLYGTWLGDKGHYADIVLKQGRLSNDFDIYTEAGHTSGDYDAWGTSLSGEYGMKIDLNDDWFITPQAQLTLMRIGGEDYTTNNGIKVHQESLESAVGRIGFEVGKRISGSGSIYAKASLLHDFAGSADTYLSLNGLTNSYHQDIGDTWCEAGLGLNFKTSDNSYIYADVVKTFGGDVETPWQWNAGMRWTF